MCVGERMFVGTGVWYFEGGDVVSYITAIFSQTSHIPPYSPLFPLIPSIFPIFPIPYLPNISQYFHSHTTHIPLIYPYIPLYTLISPLYPPISLIFIPFITPLSNIQSQIKSLKLKYNYSYYYR